MLNCSKINDASTEQRGSSCKGKNGVKTIRLHQRYYKGFDRIEGRQILRRL